MKKSRIINIAIAAAIWGMLLCELFSVWGENGCGFWSLFAGFVFYTAGVFCAWYCIDETIQRLTK